MNERDAELLGRAHGIDFHARAVEQDVPAVWRLHARENFHERALARAVLAHHRHHLAARERERHVFQGQYAGEAFGNGAHLEEEIHFNAKSQRREDAKKTRNPVFLRVFAPLR